jgi:hypothetical protein
VTKIHIFRDLDEMFVRTADVIQPDVFIAVVWQSTAAGESEARR